MNGFDQQLFQLINASSDAWGPAAYLAYVAAKFVVLVIPFHLAMIWVLGDRSVRRQALTLLAALLIAIVLSYFIGAAYPTERPFQIPLGHALIAHRPSPSFPSNHALAMFTYAATMMVLRHPRHALVFFAAGLLVAWSRVYLGVHFPLDMAGAAALSLVAAWLAERIMRSHGRRALDVADRIYWYAVLRPQAAIRAHFEDRWA